MKKSFFIIVLFLSPIVFAQDSEKVHEVKSYKINYIHEADYIDEMSKLKLEDSKMNKYYKDDKGNLIPFFTSVEEAMGNMRGYHDRNFQASQNEQYEIYVLDDYCCGNNAGLPEKITLMSDNNIELEH